MKHRLLHTVQNFSHPRLLVFGDVMLDRYTFGLTRRVSPEAPVIVLQKQHQESRLGGAASVCQMIRGLGGEVEIIGVIGTDQAGLELLSQLSDSGIEHTHLVTDPARPTTVKERYLGNLSGGCAHQLLRVDTEDSRSLKPMIRQQLIEPSLTKLNQVQSLLISDYDKGVCSTETTQTLIAAAGRLNCPTLVDPAYIDDYSRYRGASIVTPNRREAELVTGTSIVTITDAFEAGETISKRYSISNVSITLDADGIALVHDNGQRRHLESDAQEICDVTGAGDMVLAMLGMCVAQGIDLTEAAALANVAAGQVIQKVGTADLSLAELTTAIEPGTKSVTKVLSRVNLEQEIQLLRQRGLSLVFTNGCFDLLHAGHLACLHEAASKGDRLIVGINSDRSVRALKGNQRPIIGELARANLLAALECVDYVVIFDELTPHEILQQIQPDILVKGGTYVVEEVVGREIVESYGGCVHVTGVTENISTTNIIESIVSAM